MTGLRTTSAADPGFLPYALDVKRIIDAALERFLGEKLADARRQGGPVVGVVEVIADLTMRGGKRLRPALMATAYEACGGGEPVALAMGGVALELLQTYLLIHDDWMDNDDIRRGGPSAHVMLGRALGSATSGAVAAILAGDFACALAQEALLSLPMPPERLRAAAAELAIIQKDVIAGQLLDTQQVARDRDELERMHDLKTGSYTVRGPFELGAILAGAGPVQREALTAIARPLGIAFQLRDDVLGTFGVAEQTGKPTGNDLRSGKRTALVIELETDAVGASLLQSVLGNPDAEPAAIDAVIARMETGGAKACVENRIQCMVAQVLAHLPEAPFTAHGKALIAGAANALAFRNR